MYKSQITAKTDTRKSEIKSKYKTAVLSAGTRKLRLNEMPKTCERLRCSI